jgi:2-amino-4-hydroxy-6-hydroxymethyldihydropteridine diphosphokinase
VKRSDDGFVVVAFGLGSNLGDREAALCLAVRLLSRTLVEARLSSPYSSAPLYDTAQPPFLNAVLVGSSRLDPEQLLGWAKAIEWTAGRKARRRFGPRELDIDLLVFNGLTLDRPELRLPHPRLREREFVLAPLAEIAPTLSIPPDRSTPADLLESVRGRQGVERKDWSLRCRELMP